MQMHRGLADVDGLLDLIAGTNEQAAEAVARARAKMANHFMVTASMIVCCKGHFLTTAYLIILVP